jgi:hypothetical protein
MTTIADYGDDPNIMFFRGIFPKQYDIENIFTNQLLASIEPMRDIYNITQYSPIPGTFTTTETWPTSTNILCWHCHRKIPNTPLFSPTRIIKGTNSDYEMMVCGAMCSFVCVTSYIDSSITNPIIKDNRHRMLKVLYYVIHGKEINYIPRAMPHTAMSKYGGSVSEVDYYKMIDEAEERLGSLI